MIIKPIPVVAVILLVATLLACGPSAKFVQELMVIDVDIVRNISTRYKGFAPCVNEFTQGAKQGESGY